MTKYKHISRAEIRIGVVTAARDRDELRSNFRAFLSRRRAIASILLLFSLSELSWLPKYTDFQELTGTTKILLKNFFFTKSLGLKWSQIMKGGPGKIPRIRAAVCIQCYYFYIQRNT